MDIRKLYNIIKPLRTHINRYDEIDEVSIPNYNEYLELKAIQGIVVLLDLEIEKAEKELETLKKLNQR